MKSEVLLNSASRKNKKRHFFSNRNPESPSYKEKLNLEEAKSLDRGDIPGVDKLCTDLTSDSRLINGVGSGMKNTGPVEGVSEPHLTTVSCDQYLPITFGILSASEHFPHDLPLITKHSAVFDSHLKISLPDPGYDISREVSPGSQCFRSHNRLHVSAPTVETSAVAVPLMTASVISGHALSDESQQGSQTVSPQNNFPVSYLQLCPNMKERVSPGLQFHHCRWVHCDMKFFNMDDLVNHVNDQHVKVERPDVDYQCKWDGCPRRGKGFNARYKMLIHIRTHTNEKPYRCNLCGKCFSRLENLKIHNRSHTGEKPYVCPFEGCNKSYSNSSDRFKHVRTHQEEKPYICKMPGCNKRYTDPSSLRKHVRTHGHYFNGENETKTKLTSTETLISKENSHSPLTPPTASLPCVSQKSFSIVSSGSILPSAMHAHMMSSQNIMHVSKFPSNPLLSSAVLTGSIQPIQNDGMTTASPNSPIKVDMEGEKITADSKCQDGPLDLTTSSPSNDVVSDVEIGDRENSGYHQNGNSSMHSAFFGE